MATKSLSPNSSNLSNADNINNRSKLRRLRIQETLLLQCIQKTGRNANEDVETYEAEISSTSSYSDLLTKVKDSYINLKNLYDEVKTNTQSQEQLADLDIDEIRKKIFELETIIRTFKSDINYELAALRLSEQSLNKQLAENPDEVEIIKRRPKTRSVNYNAIVPSPVRVLRTSPFKCSEVQQFQEFMENSPNRYGGWNEYNHNIFFKYWHKFFGKSFTSELEDGTIQQSITYEMFIEDVMPKVQGVTTSEINSHVKWYLKYIFLKENQQNAIDKWKWNKMSARNVQKKVKYADEEDSCQLETTLNDHSFIACNSTNLCNQTARPLTKSLIANRKPDRTHSIMKPTKQWLNRSDHSSDIGLSSGFHCIENTGKLRTPQWRLGL